MLHAINHREEEVGTALAAACADGVVIYFDNVGGVTLDTGTLVEQAVAQTRG